MAITARPQQRYDHRLRHLVQRTGDVTRRSMTLCFPLTAIALEPVTMTNRLHSVLLVALAITTLGLHSAPPSQSATSRSDSRWIGTWATAPAGVADPPRQFDNQTLRLIVRISAGGDEVRVRIANTFGTVPLAIGAAHIARRAAGASIQPQTDRSLTFGGRSSFAVPADGSKPARGPAGSQRTRSAASSTPRAAADRLPARESLRATCLDGVDRLYTVDGRHPV